MRIPVTERITTTMIIMLVSTSLSVSCSTSEQGSAPTLSVRHLQMLSIKEQRNVNVIVPMANLENGKQVLEIMLIIE